MKSTLLQTSLIVALLAAVAHAGPVVDITKRCPNLRYVGRNATFEITVTNTGDSPAVNVVVTDTITGAMQFISADNNGARQGNNVVWRLGTLDAGQSRTLTSTVVCHQIGRITNKAMVTWCAEAMAMCELEVKGIPAILLECVDDPDPIELNGTLTYTITVTNQGSATDRNVVINVTLPPEEQYVSSTGPTQATAEGPAVRFAPLATLAPKAKAIYKVTVRGVAVGDVRFKVELTSDQLTTPVMETESTHVYD